MTKCPECGKEIEIKNGTCPNCGYPFEDGNFQKDDCTSGVADQEKETTEPPAEQALKSDPDAIDLKVGNKKKRIIVIVALVVAVIVVILIAHFAKSPTEDQAYDAELSESFEGAQYSSVDDMQTSAMGVYIYQEEMDDIFKIKVDEESVTLRFDGNDGYEKEIAIKSWNPVKGTIDLTDGSITLLENDKLEYNGNMFNKFGTW